MNATPVLLTTLSELAKRRGTTLDQLMHYGLDNYVYGIEGNDIVFMYDGWEEAIDEIDVNSP